MTSPCEHLHYDSAGVCVHCGHRLGSTTIDTWLAAVPGREHEMKRELAQYLKKLRADLAQAWDEGHAACEWAGLERDKHVNPYRDES
jgi:hypothetical protein